MASTFHSVEVTRGDFRYNEKGVYPLYGTYELAAALVQNDVIQMANIKEGTRVIEVMVFTDDLEASGSATVFDVGDSGSTARFITGSTIAQAGGQVSSKDATYGVASGLGYQYTANDTIDIKFTAVGTGNTSGTVTLYALVCNDV